MELWLFAALDFTYLLELSNALTSIVGVNVPNSALVKTVTLKKNRALETGRGGESRKLLVCACAERPKERLITLTEKEARIT